MQQKNDSFLHRIRFFELIIMAYVMLIGLGILFNLLFPKQQDALAGEPMGFAFFAGVIAGPLLETAIVQHLCIRYSKKWTKRYWPGFILSVLLFSVLHHYSLAYMLKTLFSGIVYASVYTICSIRQWNGYIWTTLVHSLNNLTGFFILYVFQL